MQAQAEEEGDAGGHKEAEPEEPGKEDPEAHTCELQGGRLVSDPHLPEGGTAGEHGGGEGAEEKVLRRNEESLQKGGL